ncbi:hypothetical protein HHK36_018260 [Tetracentron sinense]|uniref:Uncharacterized protein n=1 Tax=Tetracentron sinense TaxID=13715 RepID=A0A834Z3K1_TETSI|nr:hypothetical protein HHK36_018260 [Tetracentron sinense]
MAERCLMGASLAALVFHPSSTIKFFKPKSNTNSPEKQMPPPPKDSHLYVKRGQLQFKIKQEAYDQTHLTASNGSAPKDPSPIESNTLFHAVSELVDGDPTAGIIKTIFLSGWNHPIGPKIEKILRVNHTTAVLDRFEEYRELVKSKAAETCVSKRKERWVVDGNEVLRYHGDTVMCSLGCDGNLSICCQKSCRICSINGSGFSARAYWKLLYENSRSAHEKTKECVNGVTASTAMLICRVIEGRVAHGHGQGLVDGEEGSFDSVVGPAGDQSNDSEELIILDSRAVLPCLWSYISSTNCNTESRPKLVVIKFSIWALCVMFLFFLN